MHPFSILPSEHRGSGASTAPHAQCESATGGRGRRFALKMREGVIYFREPKRAAQWAVTRVWVREMAGEELIEAWKTEVERENYGRYLVYRPFLFEEQTSSGGVQTAIAIVHRAEYSGWAREWFDQNWLDVPAHRDGKTLDVWGDKFELATRRVLHHTHRRFLNRALPASTRRNIETRWARGDETALQRVFALGLRLLVREDELAPTPPRTAWTFYASNPVEIGGWGTMSPGSYHQTPLRYSLVWNDFLKLLEQNFVLSGLKWKRETTPVSYHGISAHQRKKWGEDWRGDWNIETPKVWLEARPAAYLSGHERLETSLELRDWLRDKISPRQLANWLSKTLD